MPFGGRTEDEVLAAWPPAWRSIIPTRWPTPLCRAAQKGINHEEMHSEVQYVVAHGIASRVSGEKVVIGSQHFRL